MSLLKLCLYFLVVLILNTNLSLSKYISEVEYETRIKKEPEDISLVHWDGEINTLSEQESKIQRQDLLNSFPNVAQQSLSDGKDIKLPRETKKSIYIQDVLNRYV